MDDFHFDAWTKRIAASTTRRGALKLLGGGLFGSIAVVGTAGNSAAFICRQAGVLCAKDGQCCSGSCFNFHCACPEGEVSCGRSCCLPIFETSCPLGTTPCQLPPSYHSTPACCGPGTFCTTYIPGADCVCCPFNGGSCPSCTTAQYSCCSSSGKNCSCCGSGQGCDANSGQCTD